MKIGYFGGAFNPPTIAHIELAKKAINEKNLDKVVFVPVSDFYKKDNLLNINLRIKMLELACYDENERNKTSHGKLEVSDIEKNLKVKTKAIDIFEMIEKVNRDLDNEIYFLMGYDNLKKMPTWKDYEKLKKYNYIVFERNNASFDNGNANNSKFSTVTNDCGTSSNIYFLKNDKFKNASSSFAREQIENIKNANNLNNLNKLNIANDCCNIENLLNKDVIKFIFNNNLY